MQPLSEEDDEQAGAVEAQPALGDQRLQPRAREALGLGRQQLVEPLAGLCGLDGEEDLLAVFDVFQVVAHRGGLPRPAALGKVGP